MAKKKSRDEAAETREIPVSVPDEREDMYRELTDEPAVYAITLEEAPVTLHSLLPDYRYRFDGVKSDSGDVFIREFTKFLETNEYLVTDDHPTRAFADGFAKAVAMAALYMDSLGLRS